MTRFFNTSGPVVAEDHYQIPPLTRLDVAEFRQLVARKRYFVLHAPRQTGKTSALLALEDLLNADGAYRCVYVNVEARQAMREDVRAATEVILSQMACQARRAGDKYLSEAWAAIFAEHGVDALLRQLCSDYPHRPGRFPQSVILCGVRDCAKTMVAGGSAFNIKAESLQLGDFSRNEVRALLGQHTSETGQAFTDGALEAVWNQTLGQPWLVNALAYETCFRGVLSEDCSRPVAEADVLEAREQLIRRRDTHLDQLTDKLQEERVRRVIEPIIVGGDGMESTADDIEYVQDLGLIARDPPMRMANPIYAEVVPRQLTWPVELKIQEDPAWYVDTTGELQLDLLLGRFQDFFREDSESWVERFHYKEAGPHGGGRGGADGGLHGPLPSRGRALGRLRPQRKSQLGREGVPRAPGRGERCRDSGLGDVK